MLRNGNRATMQFELVNQHGIIESALRASDLPDGQAVFVVNVNEKDSTVTMHWFCNGINITEGGPTLMKALGFEQH